MFSGKGQFLPPEMINQKMSQQEKLTKMAIFRINW